MKLFTKAQEAQLLANGIAQADSFKTGVMPEGVKPVVKLFGGGSFTWLLSEIDPQCPDLAFGLCDLGMGSPELGSVSLSELASLKFPPFGFPVELDENFKGEKPLSEYAEEARAAGRIVA